MVEQKWPQQIWIVRHGQSAGNLARDAAESAGHHRAGRASRAYAGRAEILTMRMRR